MKTRYKFISFCFVGVFCAFIEIIFFNLFYFINLGFVFSKIFSIFFALITNFTLNRNFTFGAINKKINKQIIKYSLVYFLAVLVNFFVSVFINFLLPKSQFYANLASISGIVSAIPISFFGSLLWAFKK